MGQTVQPAGSGKNKNRKNKKAINDGDETVEEAMLRRCVQLINVQVEEETPLKKAQNLLKEILKDVNACSPGPRGLMSSNSVVAQP